MMDLLDENKREFISYIDNFNMHYKLLLRRYARFREVNQPQNPDIDVITYFDIIIVQLRAICIENPKLKKNYTVQNLLKKMGRPDLSKNIDDMLDQEFAEFTKGYPIRKALKTLADQYICHYDKFERDDIGWAESMTNNLRSPYFTHNLDYIMEVLTDSIGEGLSISSFMANVTIVDDDIEDEGTT